MTGQEILDSVMTTTEAAERWGKTDITIRQACTGYKKSPPRFKDGEFRQSGKVWLITVEGMTRVFPCGLLLLGFRIFLRDFLRPL